MNAEKLDSLSKILLATHTINILSANIVDIMKDYDYSPIEDVRAVTGEFQAILNNAIEQLKPIMKSLGDFLNNRDAVCPIDVRITKAAFDILISGNDNVNK